MEITALEPFVHPAGHCFVRVETDEGISGIGEAGLQQRPTAVAEVVREFEADLVGMDPTRIEHCWQTMFRGGFFPGGVVQSAAVSAVDIALWDLKGKALDVPVFDLLGGQTREQVVCYPHVESNDGIDTLVADCCEKQREGWHFARWSVTDPEGGGVFEPDRAVQYTIEQVEAVRETCGDDFNICIDVHTRFDPSSAVEFCRGVEPYSPFFVEDPLRSENTDKLHQVRDHTAVPLAVGEQFDSKWAFQQAIEDDLMDYCRVDLCLAGGLTEARKIAGWAETHYIELAPHNPLGPVSTAACLHLCLASPAVGVQELPFPPGTILPDAFPTQVPFEDGHLLPPEKPGLGVTFDPSTFEDLDAYEPGPGVGYEREDGSYTNW